MVPFLIITAERLNIIAMPKEKYPNCKNKRKINNRPYIRWLLCWYAYQKYLCESHYTCELAIQCVIWIGHISLFFKRNDKEVLLNCCWNFTLKFNVYFWYWNSNPKLILLYILFDEKSHGWTTIIFTANFNQSSFSKSCLTSNVKYVQYFGYTLPHISSRYTAQICNR